MKERVNYSSGSPLEPLRGFSRAVKVGDMLMISGTTAMSKSGEVVSVGDAYGQTKKVIEYVKEILAQAGFELKDVVMTRLLVTNMAKWDEYARAHREAFETIRPASSIVQVERLFDYRLMVEMEVQAIKGAGDALTERLG